MDPDHDVLRRLADDASPLDTEGYDSDQPVEPSSEPSPPPHLAAVGNATPVRGLGVAPGCAVAEGVELMSGNVATGSRGVEVAPAGGYAKL